MTCRCVVLCTYNQDCPPRPSASVAIVPVTLYWYKGYKKSDINKTQIQVAFYMQLSVSFRFVYSQALHHIYVK